MQLQNVFDATKFDPTQGIPQLPVGKHPVIIADSEIKATQDGQNGMAVFTLQIIDGPAKGQTGAYRLNLYHSNPQTVEIAHKQLSALCHVVGVYTVQDTRQLHNLPFVVEVGLQRDTENAAKGYTEVKRVYDRNGNEPGKQTQQGPAQPQTQQPPQGGHGAGAGAWSGNGGPAGHQGPPAGSGAPAWAQNAPAGGGAPANAGGAPAWANNAPAGGAPANTGAQPGNWGQGGGNAPWAQR